MFMASSSITRTVGLCSSILRSLDGVKLGAIMKQFESSKSSTLSLSASLDGVKLGAIMKQVESSKSSTLSMSAFVIGLGANVTKDPTSSLAGLFLSLKVTKPS